jgi:hypothetical protein
MTMSWEAQVHMLISTSTPAQIEDALHAVLTECGTQGGGNMAPPYYQGRAGLAADLMGVARQHLDPPLTRRTTAA